MTVLGIIAFIVLISVVSFCLYKNANEKRKQEIEKVKYQKEILELEIEKEKITINPNQENNFIIGNNEQGPTLEKAEIILSPVNNKQRQLGNLTDHLAQSSNDNSGTIQEFKDKCVIKRM
jgi:hypothetical protein